MNDSAHQILEAWQNYVVYKGCEKTKISANSIHENQQIFLDEEHFKEHPEGAILSLSQATVRLLREQYAKFDQHGKLIETTPIQFLFPILRIIEKENRQTVAKYLPLFTYTLPASILENDKETRILIPIKDETKVSPQLFVFRNILKINIDELGENRHMMSLVSALTSKKYDTAYEALKDLNLWTALRIQHIPNIQLENAFHGLTTQLHNEDFNTKRDKQDYEYLISQDIENHYPLLHQYITAEKPSYPGLPTSVKNSLIYGLFEPEYPLGQGQIHAIQALNHHDHLIAVQGAPGTGKTTLFKSLIAQKVVERALGLIQGKDQNLGMLVTSTAKTAVENVIDDLKKDPLTKNLNWLWFHSGSKEQVQQEVNRIDTLLLSWQNQAYNSELQQANQARILKYQNEIESSHQHYFQQRHEVEKILAKYQTCISESEQALKQHLNSSWNPVREALSALDIAIPEQSSKAILALVDILSAERSAIELEQQQRSDARQAVKMLEATWPIAHTWQEISNWLQSHIRVPLETNYAAFPTSGLSAKWQNWFPGQYKAMRQKLADLYSQEYSQFELAAKSHQELALLAQASSKIHEGHELQIHLDCLRQTQPDSDRLQSVEDLLEQLQQLELLYREIEQDKNKIHKFEQTYPEGEWDHVFRNRFIQQNRALFEEALSYLQQEQLKRKQELTEILTFWKQLLLGECAPKFYAWKDSLEKFYTQLSLVYPIVATTLASAYKAAGYKNLRDLNGFKPWHLALCDEAGMISPEDLVPLLSRSQRAVVVGDPLQLEPIRTLSEGSKEQLRQKFFAEKNTQYEKVSPTLITAYHRAAGTLSGQVNDLGNGIILDEHRRCQPPIAQLFSQLAGYKGITIETAPPRLKIQQAFEAMGSHHLMFYSVEGQKGTAINTNIDEIDAIETLLDRLEEAGYDLTKDVGIITPYANQKQLLIKRVGDRVTPSSIGSVHQFQGVGYEVIIYSAVIHRPTDRDTFQNRLPNLLNVAVSRAKQQFIIVGNYHRLVKAGGYLQILAEQTADKFLLELGRQSTQFEQLKSKPQLQRYYRDCEHITAFEYWVNSCQRELQIIVPWIRYGSKSLTHPQLALLKAAKERGVTITIFYGYDHVKFNRGKNDDNAPDLIAQYQNILGKQHIIRLPEGTHEKLILIDGHTVTIGSLNWLSHGYYDWCARQNRTQHNNLVNLAIRREITAVLNDPKFVSELQTRLQSCSTSPA